MKAEELFRVLELAIHDGHGNADVYFDTEARTFDYHMAKVGSAYCEQNFGRCDGSMAIYLHEERARDARAQE